MEAKAGVDDGRTSPSLLSVHSFTSLLDSIEAFLFDCDGVIWKGEKLIEGVSEALGMLRSNGKKASFRDQQLDKIKEVLSK